MPEFHRPYLDTNQMPRFLGLSSIKWPPHLLLHRNAGRILRGTTLVQCQLKTLRVKWMLVSYCNDLFIFTRDAHRFLWLRAINGRRKGSCTLTRHSSSAIRGINPAVLLLHHPPVKWCRRGELHSQGWLVLNQSPLLFGVNHNGINGGASEICTRVARVKTEHPDY